MTNVEPVGEPGSGKKEPLLPPLKRKKPYRCAERGLLWPHHTTTDLPSSLVVDADGKVMNALSKYSGPQPYMEPIRTLTESKQSKQTVEKCQQSLSGNTSLFERSCPCPTIPPPRLLRQKSQVANLRRNRLATVCVPERRRNKNSELAYLIVDLQELDLRVEDCTIEEASDNIHNIIGAEHSTEEFDSREDTMSLSGFKEILKNPKAVAKFRRSKKEKKCTVTGKDEVSPELTRSEGVNADQAAVNTGACNSIARIDESRTQGKDVFQDGPQRSIPDTKSDTLLSINPSSNANNPSLHNPSLSTPTIVLNSSLPASHPSLPANSIPSNPSQPNSNLTAHMQEEKVRDNKRQDLTSGGNSFSLPRNHKINEGREPLQRHHSEREVRVMGDNQRESNVVSTRSKMYTPSSTFTSSNVLSSKEAAQRKRENRKPPSKPLPYAVSKKLSEVSTAQEEIAILSKTPLKPHVPSKMKSVPIPAELPTKSDHSSCKVTTNSLPAKWMSLPGRAVNRSPSYKSPSSHISKKARSTVSVSTPPQSTPPPRYFPRREPPPPPTLADQTKELQIQGLHKQPMSSNAPSSSQSIPSTPKTIPGSSSLRTKNSTLKSVLKSATTKLSASDNIFLTSNLTNKSVEQAEYEDIDHDHLAHPFRSKSSVISRNCSMKSLTFGSSRDRFGHKGSREVSELDKGASSHVSDASDDQDDTKSCSELENGQDAVFVEEDDTYVDMKPGTPNQDRTEDLAQDKAETNEEEPLTPSVIIEDITEESDYVHMNPSPLIPKDKPQKKREPLYVEMNPPPTSPAPIYASFSGKPKEEMSSSDKPPKNMKEVSHYAFLDLLRKERHTKN